MSTRHTEQAASSAKVNATRVREPIRYSDREPFDAVLHFDHTRALEPLERTADWEMGEVEETFPSGL